MKITAITQQVKRADRYSVYVDGKYSFSLGESEVIQSGLHNGQELSDSDIEAFKDQSKLGKLYDRTLNLLSYRPRSEWELRDYLRRKKQDDDTIEKILYLLSKSGYVDDQQFAKRWVENRRLLKSTSQRRLRAELKQKHVANDIIDAVLAADETDEHVVLRELIKRKAKRYPDRTKLLQFVVRQGFNYSDAKEVIDEFIRGEQPET